MNDLTRSWFRDTVTALSAGCCGYGPYRRDGDFAECVLCGVRTPDFAFPVETKNGSL